MFQGERTRTYLWTPKPYAALHWDAFFQAERCRNIISGTVLLSYVPSDIMPLETMTSMINGNVSICVKSLTP